MNRIVSGGELNGSRGEIWPEGVFDTANSSGEKDEATTGGGIRLCGETGEECGFDGGTGGIVERSPVNGECTTENQGGKVTENRGWRGAKEM